MKELLGVLGYDATKTNSKDLAKIVSILRQENHLFVTRLTVRQLVGFGRFPHSKGRLNQVDEEIISRSIDFLDLGELKAATLMSSPAANASAPTLPWFWRKTPTPSCLMNH